jgi:hypothetical protein
LTDSAFSSLCLKTFRVPINYSRYQRFDRSAPAPFFIGLRSIATLSALKSPGSWLNFYDCCQRQSFEASAVKRGVGKQERVRGNSKLKTQNSLAKRYPKLKTFTVSCAICYFFPKPTVPSTTPRYTEQ